MMVRRRVAAVLAALAVGLMPCLTAVLNSAATYAKISEDDLYFYNENRIYLWDPNGSNNGCASVAANGNNVTIIDLNAKMCVPTPLSYQIRKFE